MAALPIYLVHWNARDWLEEAVASIRRSTIDVELTVINNGGDLSGIDAEIVESGANLGYAGGANLAISRWFAGTAPFAVVGAHDMVVAPDALERMLVAAEGAPRFGIVGPRQRDELAIGPLEEGIRPARYVYGLAMLLRRACIEEIGALDERFGSYGEDVDLSLRAQKRGWLVGTVDDAHVRPIGHVAGTGRVMLMAANRVLLKRKHESYLSAMVEVGRIAGRIIRHARNPPVRAPQAEALPLALRHLRPWAARGLRSP